MRVLIDGRSIGRTGIGTYTKMLIKGLSSKVEKLYVMGKLDQSDFEGIEVVKVSGSIYSVKEQFETFLAELKVIDKVDLVHYVNYNKSIFSTLPFVITIHDLIQFKFAYSSKLKRTVGEKLLKVSLKNSSAIICVSESTKRDLIEFYDVDEKKIFVVYNPAVNPFYKEPKYVDVKGKYNLGNYILSVGMRKKHKNFAFLIRSMEFINKEFPELKLVIVGKRFENEDEVDIALKDSPVRDKIVILENVNYDELVSLYKDAEMVVMPSLYEGFGFVPFESINFGTLPLISDIPTSRELFFKDNDILFNPYSTENLIQKIKEFYDEEKKKEKVKELRKYLEIYSYDRFINETLKVYQFVVANV